MICVAKPVIAIIGAGPAGLFAAQILAENGCHVEIYEQKPTPARKFLMAGRGGLNITHSEDFEKFAKRYGSAEPFIKTALDNFTPNDMRAWCKDMGEDTFIGTSGRVFPKSMKASPLLRQWMYALEKQGVKLHSRHRWTGWDDAGKLTFIVGSMQKAASCDALLLSMGGASWPSLGSDGTWVHILKEKDIDVVPFRPSNCGFKVEWSDYIRQKFAGKPLKGISLSLEGHKALGEIMITEHGIEGGAVYALSRYIREDIERKQTSFLQIDLRPNMSVEEIISKLSLPRARHSFSTWLQKCLKLSPLDIALLREAKADIHTCPPRQIAIFVKALPLVAIAPFSLERSISSAGGISLAALDENHMIKRLPGVFAAGEMLDWEAPTGGYLLQGCFATGKAAATGILRWLQTQKLA